MVGFWHINYPFQTGGISSLKFVPGICSFALDGNTNLSYLDVENMLSTPSVVEMTNSNLHRITKGNAIDEVTQMLLRGKIFFQTSWEIS